MFIVFLPGLFSLHTLHCIRLMHFAERSIPPEKLDEMRKNGKMGLGIHINMGFGVPPPVPHPPSTGAPDGYPSPSHGGGINPSARDAPSPGVAMPRQRPPSRSSSIRPQPEVSGSNAAGHGTDRKISRSENMTVLLRFSF